MKSKCLNQVILLFSILFIFSCSVEEAIELDSQVEAVELDPQVEEVVLTERNSKEKNTKVSYYARPYISGCGLGFKVTMDIYGWQPTQAFYYQIWTVPTTAFMVCILF